MTAESQTEAIEAGDAASLLRIGEAAVQAAIPRFLEGLGSEPGWHSKADRDPVSDVDVSIEMLIRDALRPLTPDIEFVGEETGGVVPKSGRAWGLDPIDGTVNFLHGLPLCAISLGLFVNGVPSLGVVALPALQLTYRGAVGHGATRNGQPIRPSSPSTMRECVVSVGDYSTGEGADEKNVDRLGLHHWLASTAYRVRMLGSAALDLVWVADGTLGASVVLSNQPWDMAGGTAIARAAGAIVVGRHGEPHQVASIATIASGSRHVVDTVVGQLRSAR